MPVSLDSAAIGTPAITTAGMRADMELLRVTAFNLANAATPGFRREIAGASAFDALLAKAGAGASAGASGSDPAVTPPPQLDMTPGPLRATGRALDVAITGPGFLEVTTDHGPAYTRNGALRVDGQGRLVTEAGYALAGDGGEIRVDGNTVRILVDGQVMQGDRAVGQLRVVRFAKPALTPLGDGLYASPDAPDVVARGSDALRVGFLETSNVSTAGEMLRMTELLRHFESLQKVMQGHDDAVEKAVRKLGEL